MAHHLMALYEYASSSVLSYDEALELFKSYVQRNRLEISHVINDAFRGSHGFWDTLFGMIVCIVTRFPKHEFIQTLLNQFPNFDPNEFKHENFCTLNFLFRQRYPDVDTILCLVRDPRTQIYDPTEPLLHILPENIDLFIAILISTPHVHPKRKFPTRYHNLKLTWELFEFKRGARCFVLPGCKYKDKILKRDAACVFAMCLLIDENLLCCCELKAFIS